MKKNWRAVVLVLLTIALTGFAVAQVKPISADAVEIHLKEQRVALIIGNGSYESAPLKNPGNDATDIAAALKSLGFKVILKIDATRREMRRAVSEFRADLKKGGVGLFYFAGHGLQVKGRNYLVPVKATIETEADVEDEALDADFVMNSMEEAGNRVNIIILDACRNNPYTGSFRSASRGLAPVESKARGSFIAYATAPGSVAHDGEGRNGLYTKHLLDSLRAPDSDIEKVFKRVRAGVATETRNAQVPWDSSSLLGDFRFNVAEISAETAKDAAKAPPVQPADSVPERGRSAHKSVNIPRF